MCGILIQISKKNNSQNQSENERKLLQEEVGRRGPDFHSNVTVEVEMHYRDAPDSELICINISSWVLHLRGKDLQKQPVVEQESGNVLAFNGEIYEFGGDDLQNYEGNDTENLSRLLSLAAPSESAILDVIAQLKGEWALAYYVASTGILYFGRDFLGRRSLLYQSDPIDGSFTLSSVTNGASGDQNCNWIELGCTGIYKLDIKGIGTEAASKCANFAEQMKELSWGNSLPYPTNIKMNMHNVDPEVDLTNLDEINISQLPSILTTEQFKARNMLSDLLSASVLRRINAIPTHNTPPTNSTMNPSKLAILFSGGLDCMVLAALASTHLDQREPIDLLNVSFENPRSLKARKASQEATIDPYLTPDRKTGMEGYAELCLLYPTRPWRFVKVDVAYEEAMDRKQYIMDLMYPLVSVMDLSIAMAFWFASRGVGRVYEIGSHVNVTEEEVYTSTARVLLSGLGADEQLGGYSRHGKAFEKGGWKELADEIGVDVGRISQRNLGRDDRIISSHGKEVRFPFLDENVFGFLSSLPVHLKTDPRFDRAVGDKILLRLVAQELGLNRAAVEAKRAVQFGARTAKMDLEVGSKQKGQQANMSEHHQDKSDISIKAGDAEGRIGWVEVCLQQYECQGAAEKIRKILQNSQTDTISKVEELDETLDSFFTTSTKSQDLKEECVRILVKTLEEKGKDSMDETLVEPVGTSSLGPWKLLIRNETSASTDGHDLNLSKDSSSSSSTPMKKRVVGSNITSAVKMKSAAIAAQEAAAAAAKQVADSSVASAEQSNYSALNNSNNNIQYARVDDVTELALTAHFSELSMLGVPSENVDALVDPYEQELDVYTSLSPAALVQNLFSHMTPEQIESVLEHHHYNIEDTMDALFNFESSSVTTEDTAYDTTSTASASKKASKQVCRHFLLGQCYRSDCWYSHDPEVVLCKFWLKGRCFKGDSCEFSHGQALEQIQSRSKVNSQSSSTPVQAPPSLEEFPALGGPPAKPKIDFWAPVGTYNDALKKAAAPADKMALAAAQIQAQKKQYLKSLDTDWVETGDNLNNTYLDLRKDAIEVALNRNKLFQQATEAYLAGNKAAARALSLSAHQLNSQVTRLHADAAKTIFKKRNPHLGGIRDGNAIIDLHGLHPNEGIEILDDSLKDLVFRKFKGKVVIVTGTGHHSRGRVKVAPAIRQHLETNGWRPKEASLSDGRGGMIVIKL